MSALSELLSNTNWELEEQFEDGHSLGYSEPFYIGDYILEEARAEYSALKQRIEELEAMLRKSEFAAFDYDSQANFCWSCGARSVGVWDDIVYEHKSGCKLKAILSTKE